MKIKIRKIRRQFRKFFGFSDEKYARGCGTNGYGRCYGANRQGGNHMDNRTIAEKKNDFDRKENSFWNE